MNRTLIIVLIAGLVTGSLVIAHRRATARAELQARWERLKAERAAELERASQQMPRSLRPMVIRPTPQDPLSTKSKADSPNPADARLTESSNGAAVTTQTVPGSASAVTTPPAQKAPLQDPLAREALMFVGGDPEAEAVWVDAINNPDLPPKERQDLIEDLNEEGFADPKNLTPDDLPLILSRLELIERYAPSAMDDVNLAAFMEAYKDLANMAARLMQ
jgi:hypothetical protein